MKKKKEAREMQFKSWDQLSEDLEKKYREQEQLLGKPRLYQAEKPVPSQRIPIHKNIQ